MPLAPQSESKPPLNEQNGAVSASREFFKKYESVEDILYAPEEALKEGLGMVKTIKMCLKSLDVGSKMRQEVWMNEIKK